MHSRLAAWRIALLVGKSVGKAPIQVITRTRGEHCLKQIRTQIFHRYFDGAPIERERIISALYEANWNRTKAADLLEVSRMTLYRKMSKLGIHGQGTAA